MMYKIFGKKEGKAFCYPVDKVVKNKDGSYNFRDIKDKTYHNCSANELVENPKLTGKEFHGFKEIYI